MFLEPAPFFLDQSRKGTNLQPQRQQCQPPGRSERSSRDAEIISKASSVRQTQESASGLSEEVQ